MKKEKRSSPKKKQTFSRLFYIITVTLSVLIVVVLAQGGNNGVNNVPNDITTYTNESNVEGASSGFNQNGYNYTARLFNGTGSSWCLAKGLPNNCMGIYSPDKLVMKWNAEWDRGNDENWSKPPYGAWTDNEWNGRPGGSGEVWHYKIVWNGPCGADYTDLPGGGYCIWGQFKVVMDQGIDPNVGPGHIWFTKATPAGYGAYK